ncbi:MAG: Gfo/Idh/MocA family oxidoreductase [Pirellula sp.]
MSASFDQITPTTSRFLQSIAFCGGGRWGTIFFEELTKQIHPSTNLIWVTRDANKKKEEWRRKVTHENIEFIEGWHDRLTECDGAIVATSVDRHYTLSRDFLSAAVPVLCEKPIATTRQHLDHLLCLSKTNNVPLGIHLEFTFLEAFDDFIQKAKPFKIDRIQAQWFDPEIEIRGDVVKQAESQCDIISDQLPHVWSLVSRINPKSTALQLDSLRYSTGLTELTGKLGDASLEIQLSRRQEKRRRFISLNSGAATFDFCIEPPTATVGKKELSLKTTNTRPLQSTIRSFLSQLHAYKVVKSGILAYDAVLPVDTIYQSIDSNWMLAVENYYPFLVQCLEISNRLKGIQDNIISQMVGGWNQGGTESPDLSENEVQMVLDRWLPQGIASGAWYRPGSKENDHEMARQILTSLYKQS